MANKFEAFRIFEFPVDEDKMMHCPECSFTNRLKEWIFVDKKKGVGIQCPKCDTIFSDWINLNEGDFEDLMYQNDLVEVGALNLLKQIYDDIENNRIDSVKQNLTFYKEFLERQG